jgi:predicted O-methyltransferase YrrM
MIYSRSIKYFNYFLLSGHKRGHGIHSPFVYDLVSRVFRNKIDSVTVLAIEKVRKKLISDKRSILVRDFGSRADSLKTSLRRVSDITRYSTVPRKYGELLSNMAVEFGKPLIIELGTSVGISTMYMAASCPDATVYTIEGCPETAAIARQLFNEAGLNNIRIMEGPFEKYLPGFEDTVVKPGLVFIDGNHRKKAVIKYFNQIAEFSDYNTVIVIDDINYSKEMSEAWCVIKRHKKVSVIIDLFRMGILFFRKGINHNNYIIRY